MKKLLLKLIGVDGPFNGWKTISGVLLYFFPVLFPEAAPETITEFVQALGAVLIGLGGLHKAWKNLNRGGMNIILLGLLLPILSSIAHAQPHYTDVWEIAPTVQTAGAYSAGDVVGGALSLSDSDATKAISGYVQSVVLVDAADQGADYDIYLFSGALAGSYTDDAPFNPSDADLKLLVCKVSLAADELIDLSSNSAHQALGVGCAFRLSVGTSLTAVLVTGGTPTYATASDLQLRLTILEDKI